MVSRIHSPNCYDTAPANQLIVVHSTESYVTPHELGEFFAQWNVQASANVMTSRVGDSGRYVPDYKTAWECEAFNDRARGIEQEGYAAQKVWPKKQLKETARWIAQWSHEYDIPIRRGAVHEDQVLLTGVVTHKQLGEAGGGHTDPGPHYPINHVLKLAKRYKFLRYGWMRRKKKRRRRRRRHHR